MAWFICVQQNEDGGFRGRPWGLRWTEKSTLADSYHAVGALRELGFGVPRAAELAAFVCSRQRPEGAFLQDLYPETAGVCTGTYYAVSVLRALGVEIPRAWQLAHFLRGRQDRNVRRDGGFAAEDSPDWEHCTCEAFIDGRWCLLDVMFQGAFRRKDRSLCSALDIHEQHRPGGPEITTFGDWRYETLTIYWPKGGPDYTEIEMKAEDSADSPAARRAYPELSAG